VRKNILAIVFMVICPLVVAQQALNNDSVIKLVKAGLSDDLILSTIAGSPGAYDTSADGIIALKTAGASDKVTAAIVAKANAPAPAATVPPSPPVDSPKVMEPNTTQAAPVQIATYPQHAVQGSRVYIAPMEGNLDGFLSAEIMKQKLPLTVVTSDAQADYIMAGLSVKQDDHWYNAAWGGKDKNEGSVKLIGVQSKAIVWAGDAGDRSLLFSGFRRGGLRKVAERLVKEMRKSLALN
jgi:hypothetical protein